LVICLGNELVADDAVGYEVYERLRHPPLPADTQIEYAAVGGLWLLDRLTGGEQLLILVDAVMLGAPIGTVHSLAWDELPLLPAGAVLSAHAIGLRETVQIGRVVCPERVPENIRFVGVEGRCFDRTREWMSPEVCRAIECAVAEVRRQLAADPLRSEHGPGPTQ
jgi:hydrogenase maturation protease